MHSETGLVFKVCKERDIHDLYAKGRDPERIELLKMQKTSDDWFCEK